MGVLLSFFLFGLFLKRKKQTNNESWTQFINLFFIIFCHQLVARHCVKILKIMTTVDTSTVSVNIYTGLIMHRALLYALNILPLLICRGTRYYSVQVSSVQSLVSDSLRPHGQHVRPPCPAPTPGVYSNSSPLSW